MGWRGAEGLLGLLGGGWGWGGVVLVSHLDNMINNHTLIMGALHVSWSLPVLTHLPVSSSSLNVTISPPLSPLS